MAQFYGEIEDNSKSHLRVPSKSNGQVESANQDIGRFLRTYCSKNHTEWATYLSWAEYAQKSLKHSAANPTPFQCVLGYKLPLFSWNPNITGMPTVDEWFHKSKKVWENNLTGRQKNARGSQTYIATRPPI